MAAYDLLLQGGHVLDPATGLDGVFDIGVSASRITAIEEHLAAAEAVRVLDVSGSDRYVVPGLIDLHAHVAYGATTTGVGMGCCEPDLIGVASGVTTVVDGGSVGVANLGVFPTHILPTAKTRIVVYANAGSHAHTISSRSDIADMSEIDDAAIDGCIEANPGLVSGIKLRLVGPVVAERGDEVIRRVVRIARRVDVPLMVHIGDFRADGRGDAPRMAEWTRTILRSFSPGDILTHLATPHTGGVMEAADAARQPMPELLEARANGVWLDPAFGQANFGFEVAREQAQLGLLPDTISSDLTTNTEHFHSLVECMAKYMAIGCTFEQVVAMATANAARALGAETTLGSLAVGREADITVLDLVRDDFVFTDTLQVPFTGSAGIVPVQTVRAGELVAPHWGTHPWGWLPLRASDAPAGG